MNILEGYRTLGVRGYYTTTDKYLNPHEDRLMPLVTRSLLGTGVPYGKVLDLACGGGEITRILTRLQMTDDIDGIDPYLYDLYTERTGRPCERYYFEDIAKGVLVGRKYDLIICSYALHLVEKSRLRKLLFQLSRISRYLLVISPHKYPEIKESWGWELQSINLEKQSQAKLYYSGITYE
jgi:SAM-dependent methyltransferase